MTNQRSGLPTAIPTFDVGGTHVAAALVATDSWLVVPGSERRVALNSHGPADEILDAIAECGLAVIEEFADRFSVAHTFGTAMPGPFDYAGGIGHFEGVAKFESLNGYDVRSGLLARLAPQIQAITFLNDADAFLIGEWVSGAAAGANRVAGITLGTGIGSAFLADGELVTNGPGVPPFGEVHLLTIGGLPLEDVVSRRAVRTLYSELSGNAEDLDVREISALARAGDPVAAQAIHDPYANLGAALFESLANFRASALVVGGSISKSWDLVGAALTDGLASDHGKPPEFEVVQAKHLDDAALIGAAYHSVR